MALDVVWTTRALRQLRLLSPAEQASAHTVIDALRNNPAIGRYDYTRPLPNNSREIVYAVYGLLVKVRYTYRGMLHRKVGLQIEAVMPTDLVSQTQYEERTRR